jgi:hypothetical protein
MYVLCKSQGSVHIGVPKDEPCVPERQMQSIRFSAIGKAFIQLLVTERSRWRPESGFTAWKRVQVSGNERQNVPSGKEKFSRQMAVVLCPKLKKK